MRAYMRDKYQIRTERVRNDMRAQRVNSKMRIWTRVKYKTKASRVNYHMRA